MHKVFSVSLRFSIWIEREWNDFTSAAEYWRQKKCQKMPRFQLRNQIIRTCSKIQKLVKHIVHTVYIWFELLLSITVGYQEIWFQLWKQKNSTIFYYSFRSFILNRIQYNSAGHTNEQKQFDHDIKNLAKYCLLVRLQLSNSESRNKPLEYLA